MAETFAQTLARGKLGEDDISRYLREQHKARVLPAYQLQMESGKGPQLFTPDGSLIAPDMLVKLEANPVPVWCEAKTKTVFSWYHKGGYWCTGIDLKHYFDYLKVETETNWRIWMLFYQTSTVPSAVDSRWPECPASCPSGLFVASLSGLAQCESHRSPKHGNSGMVYWAHCRFKKLADYPLQFKAAA